MTRQAAEAAQNVPNLPILQEHDGVENFGMLLVTGDRGLAGGFNSQIIRAGNRRARELEGESKTVLWYASGRRGASSLNFRGLEIAGEWQGFTDRPAFGDARDIAGGIATDYIDGKVDRVEMIYNGYVSAMTQEVTTDVLLPLTAVEQLLGEDDSEEGDSSAEDEGSDDGPRTLWLYEPEPEEILARLVPDYIEISIYRALLESTASEHGARMTAMRSAQENAGEIIDDLTLEMNRQRQAEITQEIMEVVAGAEGLS